MRSGGDRLVPGPVWDTPSFQAWHRSLWEAGNRLDDAKVLWTFRIPQRRKDAVFSWVLWAKVWVASENRHKENEFVLSRPDICTGLLWYRPTPDTLLWDIEVLLVREFRVPARTEDGYIRELPGGSSDDKNLEPYQVLLGEIFEETGISISPERLRFHGAAQLAGTFSAHYGHLFSVILTSEEMARARHLSRTEESFGKEEDTEQTYVEVTTIGKLLLSDAVDWTTAGMVLKGLLLDLFPPRY